MPNETASWQVEATARALEGSVSRRFPVGAEVIPGVGVHFRVWAPRRSRVEVVLEGAGLPGVEWSVALVPEANGYYSGRVDGIGAGARYRFRLDDDTTLYPDPASRFQPDGPHGASEVVDPDAFEWTDGDWQGVRAERQVLYELHAGTFTREGTWQAAARELPELARIGITAIELMPVADFAGRFGWGYDGVNLYAPTRLYGTPDDLRRFVDRAHACGIGVILDVVYNHLGPDGCYLRAFSGHYFSERYENEWGDPLNFDDEHAAPVREYFVSNAAYWIEEFHFDGLRLDATQQIFDSSEEHVVAAITRAVRERAGKRATFVVCENEPQDTRLVRAPEDGGYGADALWNDDFHHCARVALTGRNEAYYSGYLGSPQEFVSAVKWGFLYQGQRYAWQKKRRGTPTFGLSPTVFVNYLENHDQVANSARGARLRDLGSPGRYRALTALLLLAPGTPLLFQGQEFAASSPFLFFADHERELAEGVRQGRAQFLSQFTTLATPEMQALLPDPAEAANFERCKLDFSERERHAEAYALHCDLLRLRRDDPVFARAHACRIEGAVVGPEACVLRYFAQSVGERLIVLNLGRELDLAIAPEPLLAPPAGSCWRTLWSSESPAYGGQGSPELERDEGWRIPGHALVALAPKPGSDRTTE